MLLVIDKSIAMNEGIVVDGGQALNDKRMLASLLIISPLTNKFHNTVTHLQIYETDTLAH